MPPFDIERRPVLRRRPGDGKIEVLEWTGIWQALPGEPRVEGVNHVAFGVSDMAATREFYSAFGFSHLILESDGYFEPMRPGMTARCRAAHGADTAGPGRRDRAGAAASGDDGRPRRLGTPRPDGVRDRRHEHGSGFRRAQRLPACSSAAIRRPSMSGLASGGTPISKTPTACMCPW